MSFIPTTGHKNMAGQIPGKAGPIPKFQGTPASTGGPGLSKTLNGNPELRTDEKEGRQWFSSVWNSLIAPDSIHPSGKEARSDDSEQPAATDHLGRNIPLQETDRLGKEEQSEQSLRSGEEISRKSEARPGNGLQPDKKARKGDGLQPDKKARPLEVISSEQKAARGPVDSKSAGPDTGLLKSLKITKQINTELPGKKTANDAELPKSTKAAKADTPLQEASKVAEKDKKPSFAGISRNGTVTTTNGRNTAFSVPAGADPMPKSGEIFRTGQMFLRLGGENTEVARSITDKEAKEDKGRNPVHQRYPAEAQEKDSVDQKLRFASLTREFARRMEQIVRPGTSPGIEGKTGRDTGVAVSDRDTGVKGVDAGKTGRDTEGVRNANEKVKPAPMAGQNGKVHAEHIGQTVASNNGDKMIVEQTAQSGGRLQSERYQEHIRSWAERSDAPFLPRNPVVTNGSSAENGPMPSRVTLMPVSAGYTEESLSIRKELEWEKTGAAELMEDNEDAGSDESTANVRTGRLTVINVDLRREVMPGMARLVQSARESEQAKQGSWQNHRFNLDDGKNIRISVREMDGVLQLRLGSSSTELGRMLQQHLQEIKQHLEKECDIEIDLQLDGQSADGFAGLFDERAGNDRTKSVPGQIGEPTDEVRVEKVAPQSIRNFGYNQMEWTA